MGIVQFAAVVVLTLLLMKLLLLPAKVGMNRMVDTARWLMIAGIAMLDLQFLLQYVLGLRAMGVTQAVLINLVLFIPSSWVLSLTVSYMQGRTRLSRMDKWSGGVVWLVGCAALAVAAAIDGQPLFSDTPELHWTEVAVAALYLIMQIYYSARHFKNLIAMRRSLQNYYDSDVDGMLLWMQLSIIVLIVLALMVPMLIFVESNWLGIFGILFFAGIFYFVDSFCFYVVSSTPKMVEKAEESEELPPDSSLLPGSSEDSAPSVDSPAPESAEAGSCAPQVESRRSVTIHPSPRVDSAVGQWIANNGFCQSGLTMPVAAEAIGVPRYLFAAWLKEKGCTYSAWMADLRIEEAKRVIKEHPEWNNESIATHCGFNDRTYFQKKFKEKTGLSPAEYLAS